MRPGGEGNLLLHGPPPLLSRAVLRPDRHAAQDTRCGEGRRQVRQHRRAARLLHGPLRVSPDHHGLRHQRRSDRRAAGRDGPAGPADNLIQRVRPQAQVVGGPGAASQRAHVHPGPAGAHHPPAAADPQAARDGVLPLAAGGLLLLHHRHHRHPVRPGPAEPVPGLGLPHQRRSGWR